MVIMSQRPKLFTEIQVWLSVTFEKAENWSQVIIWMFYVSGISWNNHLGITSKKNWINWTSGGPRTMHPPERPPQLAWETPRSNGSRFFCLFWLNNYFKIFQKRRIFTLLLGVTRLGYPLGGAPPRPLGPPQGSPGVTEFWKKLQKFSKII